MYEKRFYRESFSNKLEMFTVCVEETDLLIACEKNMEQEVYRLIIKIRKVLHDYIKVNPSFLSSLVPICDIREKDKVIEKMLHAGQKAQTGPFAAVAGMVSEYIGKQLEEESKNIFVENGGDIYMNSTIDRKVGIYAGKSPLSGKLSLLIKKEQFPIGICTSSGTVGHSLSFGKADAVVVLSKDTALADAVATATCNKIKKTDDLEKAINQAYEIEGIIGVVAIIGDQLGAIGDIELI